VLRFVVNRLEILKKDRYIVGASKRVRARVSGCDLGATWVSVGCVKEAHHPFRNGAFLRARQLVLGSNSQSVWLYLEASPLAKYSNLGSKISCVRMTMPLKYLLITRIGRS
jgi:hypothetical protein